MSKRDPCAKCYNYNVCYYRPRTKSPPCARHRALRMAKLERLIVDVSPTLQAAAKAYHLYPDFIQTWGPIVAEATRIARKAAR